MSEETKPVDERMQDNPAGAEAPERRRIPMSVPQRRLACPEIPGQHLYWFLEGDVPRAKQAGYEFVASTDFPVGVATVGNDVSMSGSQDLGGNIRVLAGRSDDTGGDWLVLMKIRLEWYKEDCKVLEQHNARILAGIFRNEQIMGSERTPEEDKSLRYVKTALLNRPARKG